MLYISCQRNLRTIIDALMGCANPMLNLRSQYPYNRQGQSQPDATQDVFITA
jgi:hypothetical protein